jgi:hypothetical protein
VIVIDEYLAVRVTVRSWPDGLPGAEQLVLPASRHWRLLQQAGIVENPQDGRGSIWTTNGYNRTSDQSRA